MAIFKRKVLQLCARMAIQNSFGKKASLKCLRRAMDINVNTLPQVLYLCLALHNYFELRKEKIPEQSLDLTLGFEKRLQSATSNL